MSARGLWLRGRQAISLQSMESWYDLWSGRLVPTINESDTEFAARATLLMGARRGYVVNQRFVVPPSGRQIAVDLRLLWFDTNRLAADWLADLPNRLVSVEALDPALLNSIDDLEPIGDRSAGYSFPSLIDGLEQSTAVVAARSGRYVTFLRLTMDNAVSTADLAAIATHQAACLSAPRCARLFIPAGLAE